MDRIRPLPRDEAHPDVQRYYDAEVETFGFVLNPTPVQAYRPSILIASKRLGRAIGVDGVLPAALRALICVRVAATIGCLF
jgi:hypothetical protein